MKKDDVRALEALSLAGLPEKAVIARLASIKYARAPLGKRVTDIQQAKAIILATYPEKGAITRMVKAFHDECYRQERIANDRKAIRDGLALLSRPYTQRIPDRLAEGVRHAKLMFGDYIRSAFSSDILSLMELATGDCRTYRVDFATVAVRPAISAVVGVTVEGNKGAFEEWFLLYKIPGTSTVKAVVTGTGRTRVSDAWAWQVPPAALALRGLGYTFRTDFEAQELVATGPEGDVQKFPWRGRHDVLEG